MPKTDYYGTAPEEHGVWDLQFGEYMLYQYLPVRINDSFSLPPNLFFATRVLAHCIEEEALRGNHWDYVYVTAKRGFATPGNPLNRPGWHADGFGTDDVNYVWTDKYPTLFASGDFGTISDDHIESVTQFTQKIEDPDSNVVTFTHGDKVLLRLNDRVIHAAPEIPEPGGERSFFKVSFSNDKYNLKGNAHNYGLVYDWEMFDRFAVRNDPARAGRDST